MKKTLHEQKVDIKKTWEECFGIKMEDKLTEKGVKKFWSDDFSIKECFDLLTEAGIDHVAGKIVDDLVDGKMGKAGSIIAAIIDLGDDEDEPCEEAVNEPGKYRVTRCDYILDERFASVEEAREFINAEACTSTYTVDDFAIIKEI